MRPQHLFGSCEFRAASLSAKFRIRKRARVTVRKTEIESRPRRVIERIGRSVITKHVAPVIGEPQLVRPRIPIESHRVADAAREYFEARTIGIHAHDIGVAIGIALADVAGCAHGDVELSVGTESDEFPAVTRLFGKAIADGHRSRWSIEM